MNLYFAQTITEWYRDLQTIWVINWNNLKSSAICAGTWRTQWSLTVLTVDDLLSTQMSGKLIFLNQYTFIIGGFISSLLEMILTDPYFLSLRSLCNTMHALDHALDLVRSVQLVVCDRMKGCHLWNRLWNPLVSVLHISFALSVVHSGEASCDGIIYLRKRPLQKEMKTTLSNWSPFCHYLWRTKFASNDIHIT